MWVHVLVWGHMQNCVWGLLCTSRLLFCTVHVMLCEGVRLYCTASTANAFLSKLPFCGNLPVFHTGKARFPQSLKPVHCGLSFITPHKVRMYESTEVQTV